MTVFRKPTFCWRMPAHMDVYEDFARNSPPVLILKNLLR